MKPPDRIRPAVDLGLDRRDHLERDIDAEIALHLDLRIAQLMKRGLGADEARAAALAQFGPVGTSRAQLVATAATRNRAMRLSDRLDAIQHDVAYSLRQLRRSPGFAAAVIVTLALGIGANVTMFGTIDQLLLRPPAHVADPSRVMTAALRFKSGDATHLQQVLSYPIYRDLRRATTVFQSVALYRNRPSLELGSGNSLTVVPGMLATADYFRALGVVPALGRFFTDDEAGGDTPGAPVAILGYALWQREFAGDAAILGRTIRVASTPHRVVGVAPEGFTGTGLTPIDVWLPVTDDLTAAAIAQMASQRQNFAYYIVARLQPGVSRFRAAEVATAAVVAGAREAGESASDLQSRAPRVELTSVLPRAARGDRPESKVALLLGGVSVFVLLLACTNVMNLQLARSIRRRREIAVRLALGVSRGRLLMQLALDCLLLALAGGAAGVLVAWYGGHFVRATLFADSVGGLSPVDGRVLFYAVVAATVAGLLSGMVPAVEMLRSDLVTSLKDGLRGGESRGAGRLRASFVIVQAALTTVLLAGTGAFVLSLRRIESVPLGFEADRVAVTRVNVSTRHGSALPPDDPRERARVVAIFQRLEDAARATPGVARAASALVVPFEGSYATEVFIPGRDSVPVTSEGGPYFNAISPEYFAVLGTRVVFGRAFTASDHARAPRVAIVNTTAAKLWWPKADAIGKCIRVEVQTAPCAEIVGVVEDMRRREVVEQSYVQFFIPLAQADPMVPGVVLFRTVADPDRVISLAQRRLQTALPGLPHVSVWPLDDLVAPHFRSWRLGATTFAVFGGLALVLAAFGLFSVLSYDVAHRRQELGIRTALGAAAADVTVLVAGRGFRAVAVGAVVGGVAALAGSPLIGPLLFQTSPHDPMVFAGIAALLAAASGLATIVPALRAARIDPSIALRPD